MSVYKPALKWVFKLIAGLFGILVLSFAILIWRLSSNPIELGFLTSKIQQAATDLPGGFGIKFESIQLFWDRDEKKIDLRAVGVGMFDSSGSRMVSSPEVRIALSLPALTHGVVALSSVELDEVQVHLVRNEDGSLQLSKEQSPGPADAPATDLTAVIIHTFEVLELKPDPQFPLSYLDTVKIGGALAFDDRKTNFDWGADEIDFVFSSHEDVVTGDLSISVTSPGPVAGTRVAVALTARGKDIDASLHITELRSAGLAQLTPGLKDLAAVELTLVGTVSTALTLPDTVHKLDVDIKSGAGQVAHEKFYPQPFQISSLELQANVDLPGKSLQLSNLEISLGEEHPGSPKIELSGNAQWGKDVVSLGIKALLQKLSVDDLARYWPEDVVKGTRRWLVDNLKDGAVDRASLNMAMAIPVSPEGVFHLQELNGKLAYSNLTVSYFRSLPAASGVSGSGTYDRHGFDLGVKTGQLNGIVIKEGRVVISGLDEKKAAIAVDTRLDGELADAFAVLEFPPFKLDRITGFGSGQIGGHIQADFNIAHSLRSGAGREHLKYRATGAIVGGSVKSLFKGFGIDAAELEFEIDQQKLDFKGPLEFAGIPLAFDWSSHSAEHGMISNVKLDAAKITAKQIDRLGYPSGDYFQGSIKLDVDAKLEPGGTIEASIKSNLTAAEMSLPEVRWTKASGDAASASASAFIAMAPGAPVRFNDIKLDFGTLKSAGKARFDRDESKLNAELDFLALGKTRLKGIEVTRTSTQAVIVNVQGGELDLEPFLATEEKQSDSTAVDATEGDSSGFSFEVESASLDKIYFGPDRYFDDIRFAMRGDREGLQELRASGHNPFTQDYTARASAAATDNKLKSGQFTLAYGPLVDDQYALHFEAENLGSILSVAMGKKELEGGYLVISGNSTGPLLTQPIQASLELDAFSLVNAPVMAQILNLASFSQLLNSLDHGGLAFTSVSGELGLDGTRLGTERLRAIGGSMGLTVDGWADFGNRSMNFSGSVLPLYQIVDFVGKIPLLGQVMVGKDGKGIVSMDYKLEGSFDQLEVSVQAGSRMTPGMLGNIFGSGQDKKAKDMESDVSDQDSQ